MNKSTRGFTIVELLIVIVVIAILAAISIVAYNGIQNRANNSAVQSDLATIAKKMALYKIDYGKYPYAASTVNPNDSTHAGLDELKFKSSQTAYSVAPNGNMRNLLYCSGDTYAQYVAIAKSKSGDVFYVTNDQSTPVKLAFSWADNLTISQVCTSPTIATPFLSNTGTVSTASSAAGFNSGQGNWASWAGTN